MGCLLIFAILSVFLICKSLCVQEPAKVSIVTYENENSVPGRYRFKFQTSDGTKREEVGEITNPELDNAILVVRGSYSYISLDGKRYTVKYVADEQGYRPEIKKPTRDNKRKFTPLRDIGGAAVSSLQGGGLG